MYTGHHVFTFDQYTYDLHGTCQYQLLGICEQKPGLDVIQVHAQTDGHLESELHVLINVSGVLVEINSRNTENIEVSEFCCCCVFLTFLEMSCNIKLFCFSNRPYINDLIIRPNLTEITFGKSVALS